MIIADKIISLRKRNGWSQEDLAEKLNVSRQSVSKWESAASIPDINRILEMAKIFGVTTDYLLKDEIEAEEFLQIDDNEYIKSVTLNEANDYMDEMKNQGRKIGFGVMICILSPVILILLGGLSETSKIGISEDMMGGLGVVILLCMVAFAVVLFLLCGMRMKRYEYLKNEEFSLEYGVAGIVKERQKAFEGIYRTGIIVGVVLCILCSVPLLTAAAFGAKDMTFIWLTALLLVIVSVAVLIFINVCMVKESYDRLLGEGEFDPRDRELRKKSEKMSGIYWPIVTAIYLAWSFISDDWHITWVIWPVAGLIFAGLSVALKNSK